ncbi:hypothetical protein NTM01_001640, partial [Campylobacter jejuni]|nr:hypothetical protein [Campylobacter jejuni]
MMKDLNVLATKDHYYIDKKTDMETSRHSVVAQRFTNREQFVKFFAENLFVLNNLSGNEMKFFINCLSFMNYQNTIIINSDFRKDLSKLLDISLPAISNHLKTLIEKEILIHLNPKELNESEKQYFKLTDRQTKMYLINPKVVGKGSFRDLKEMRQILIRRFNFDDLRFEQEIIDEREYNTNFDKTKKYQVADIIKSKNDNSENTTIIIDEKKEAINNNNNENNAILSLSAELKTTLNEIKKDYIRQIQGIEKIVNKVQDQLIENNQIEEYKDLKTIYNGLSNV